MRPLDGQTVTLSDGSVWVYNNATPNAPWWRDSFRGSISGRYQPHRADHQALTADDHRKIADMLDPPKSTHTATPSEFPRRNQMDHQWPVEQHIRDCVHHVESLTASPHLTEAVILLGKAREKVADFIDNVPVVPVAPSVSVEREALANRIAEKIIGRPDPTASDFRMADWLLSRYSIQEKV